MKSLSRIKKLLIIIVFRLAKHNQYMGKLKNFNNCKFSENFNKK